MNFYKELIDGVLEKKANSNEFPEVSDYIDDIDPDEANPTCDDDEGQLEAAPKDKKYLVGKEKSKDMKNVLGEKMPLLQELILEEPKNPQNDE